MRTLFLALILLGGTYVFVLLQTESRTSIQSPTQQKRIVKQRKKRRRKRQSALAYAAQSDAMAIGKENGELVIWYSSSTGGQSRLLQKSGYPIVFLTFSEDESWLLAMDDRGITQLWNTDTEEIAQTLVGLAEKGFPDQFREFVEVNPAYDCLVFRQDDKLIYYNYLTDELSAQRPIHMVNY